MKTTYVYAVVVVLLAWAAPVRAQHDMSGHMSMPGMDMPAAPLGIPDTREGSGTSWLPDETPMLGVMRHARGWMLMGHGDVFIQYVQVNGDRGDRQAGSINWFMGAAQHALAGGRFGARLMLSLEPLTVGRCGYPDLAQSGETCNGEPLHDRQHPHDLLMETAVTYSRAVSQRVAFEVYGALSGDPALGPVAFPHRPSAGGQPLAPISHHWLDASHVSFGVVTGGLFGRTWKVEASAFNGREPDDARYGLDLAPLDSYSGRVTWMPLPKLTMQVSSGHLTEAEHDDSGSVDVDRATASGTYHGRLAGRLWATTAAWGRNRAHGISSHAVLLETTADMTETDTIFGRGEWVQKSAHDLVLDHAHDDLFGITKLQAGYTRWLGTMAGLRGGVGGMVGVARLPADVASAYGTAHPVEFGVFFRIRPGPTH